ncbi:CidB/LrgB family autolysis modulator [Pasteurellaceae bacterium Macca]|nr:CidB/LrgB family autolysis modulator [Pasteurellaceae bacterium Macca]
MIYAYTFLTVGLFALATRINKRLKSSILNPFVLSLLLIIGVLFVANIPYVRYYQGNMPLNQLLGVSVVALALPFYEQLPQIRKHWGKIAVIVSIGTLLTMLSGVLFAYLLGGNEEIVLSTLSKSVSMPIALAITTEIGGNVALSAAGVVIAGITGSAFGLAVLKIIHVRNTHAIGLGLGAVSHALGTARVMEYSIKGGSYASVALVLCGLCSSLIAPLVFRWIIVWF